MVGKYLAYSEYKDSDVNWLGAVPIQWNVVSLKRKFNIVGGSTPKSDQEIFWDGEVTWVTPSDLSKLSSSLISDSQRKITSNGLASCGARLVPENSIVLSTRAPIGSLAIANIELCTNQGCKSLVPLTEFNSKFIFYLLSVSTTVLNVLGKGTTFLELSGDELGAFKVTFPSENDQQKIAAFLDHETAKIDTLIAKQQELIALLKEKRQAVISHAVTKGLNPNAPMRDSGIEWLGDVPVHWVVSRIGFYAEKIGSGKTPKGGSEIYQDEGVLFLRSQNIYDDGLRVSKEESVYISNAIHEEMSGTTVLSGDVLLNITGGSIGRTCLVPEEFVEANVNQHVCILRFPKFLNEYFSFVLKADIIKEQIESCQTGGNREGLNFEQISKLIVCVPTENEISEIVSYIKALIQKYDDIERKANLAITFMQERRTALISAAVTGKIDVRGWQDCRLG